MFKDVFVELIQNKGITAYKMSKETGISETLISNWKSGRQLPKYDSLKILADYFNVSGDYLLERTNATVCSNDNNQDLEEDEIILLKEFGKLNNEAKYALLQYLNFMTSQVQNLKNYFETSEMNA